MTDASPLPISVVLCTKDRPDELATCLASLAGQTRVPCELIVVDAGSPPAWSAVRAFRERAGAACRVVHREAEPGLPRQRNVGACEARGDVVLYLDDDTILEPDYLAALWDVYAADTAGEVGGVGGVLVPDPTPRESAAKRAFRRAFLLQSHGRGLVKRSGHPEFAYATDAPREVELLSGCNMSYRRAVLDELRFDERLSGYALGEDLHFSYRVSRRWKLVLTPYARLEHREAGAGRPDGGKRAEMAVVHRYRFVREQIALGPFTWCCFAWSALGDLLWTLRHPGGGRLAGVLRGYASVLREASRVGDAASARVAARDAGASPLVAARGAVAAPHAATGNVSNVPDASPLVSVVVPARDEEACIGRCLESLLAQTYPAGRMEILVVDNRSRDRTALIVAGYTAHDARIRLLSCDGANQADAMNLGVREARGEIVARVDAHGHVEPDYVAQAVAALARHPGVVAVGGPYLPAGEQLLERVAWLARSSRIGVGGGWYSDKQTEEHEARTVGCPVYRRDALLAAGLFDPAMAYGEDDELHWRLTQRGGRILFCPALRQHNRPRASLRALGRQYWNYGRGRLRVLRKHPDFVQPRHLVPSAFVVVLVATALAALVAPAGCAALLALLAVYGAALALAGVLVLRHGVREALLVPWAVGVMHLAYGGGMLCGAVAALAEPRALGRKEAIS